MKLGNNRKFKFRVWHAIALLVSVTIIIVAFTVENTAPFLTALVVIIAWLRMILDQLYREQTEISTKRIAYLPIVRVFEQPSYSPNDISCTFRLVNEGKGNAKVVYVLLDGIEGKPQKRENIQPKSDLLKRDSNHPSRFNYIHEYEFHFSFRSTHLHTKLMPNAKFSIEYVDNFDNGYMYVYPVKQKRYKDDGFKPIVDHAAGKEVSYNGRLAKKYSS